MAVFVEMGRSNFGFPLIFQRLVRELQKRFPIHNC